MKIIIQELMINLLYIIVVLFMYQLWIEKKKKWNEKRNIEMFIACGMAIVFCIVSPVRINEQLIYDLRHIPIWLGTLYGGPIVAAGLLVITIGLRGFIGWDVGLYVTFIVTFLQFFTGCMIHKYFSSLTSKNKVYVGSSLSIGSAIVALVTARTLFGAPFYTFEIWIVYPLVQGLAMALILFIIEMIKENVALQAKVNRAEKLEVVSHLAASISHEVRNPMTTSKGFMQLLSKGDIPPDKQNEYIAIALMEMDRAESIIRDYLTFAKPAPERQEILDIKKELERVIGTTRPLAHMNSVSVKVDIEPAFIKGDSGQIQQCFVNIVKNAIEAMPDGGNLCVNVNIDHAKNKMLITIKDDGIGLTDQQLIRLGEPYFSTKESKGTGLGLMVSFRIIEAMNGTIQVKSKVNEGTTVTVIFPIVHS